MDKQQFIETIEKLWDSDEKISITIRGIPKHKKVSPPSEKTIKLAALIKEHIDNFKYPFDIEVVAIKDIALLPAFERSTPNIIGNALAHCGCVKSGQIFDESGTPTRVWLCRDMDKLKGAPRSRIEYIFNRRER